MASSLCGTLRGTFDQPITLSMDHLTEIQQTLAKHVQIIAKRYNGELSVSYLSAAQNFRVAYWDWAEDPSLPSVVTMATLSINGPTGTTSVRNPLHSYKFQNFPFNISYMNSGVLSRDNETKRCPNSLGVDNISWVNGNLSLPSADLKDSVVSYVHDLGNFSHYPSSELNLELTVRSTRHLQPSKLSKTWSHLSFLDTTLRTLIILFTIPWAAGTVICLT